MSASNLARAVAAVCPIDGVAIINDAAHIVRIDYQLSATAGQRSAADSVAAAYDWSAGAQATRDAQTTKAEATASIDNGQLLTGAQYERLIRALALVVLDEINIIRPALPTPLAVRTSAQLVNAIKAKIALTAE